MIHPELKRIDTHMISDDKNEIRLFATTQNEELRLPYFLDYYRQMGVGRFFIVDNASTDGTSSFLLSQPDCCVFYTEGSYAASRAGAEWLNSLMNIYGDGHWIILADADELLIYPHYELRRLHEFCGWLDEKNYQGLYTLMLDMYSRLPLKNVDYKKGGDFLKVCDHFDRDYYYVRRFGVPLLCPAFPAYEPIGGPRLRLCFPDQNTKEIWPRLRVKMARRGLRMMQRLGFMKKAKAESVAPQAFKIPLVKWQRGYGFITSHRLNPIKLAPITGALLHFKYFQDFGLRVQDAIAKNNHYDGSAEYKRYGELMAKTPDLSMVYTGSLPYQGSAELVRLGLIKSDPDWDRR